MIGGIFQWKPGTQHEGEYEICTEDLGHEWKFESGKTVLKQELIASLQKVGDHRSTDLPTEPDWKNDPYASVGSSQIEIPAIPEKTLIDQLLDKQKKWDSIKESVKIEIPILSKKVYELASMMFDENEIVDAMIKRAKEEIQTKISSTVEEIVSNLKEKLENHYGSEPE